MTSHLPEKQLRALDEDEAVQAVVGSVRQLFPLVSEHQSRELARRVLLTLAERGITLAAMLKDGAPEASPG
jgi:hypothetical protein